MIIPAFGNCHPPFGWAALMHKNNVKFFLNNNESITNIMNIINRLNHTQPLHEKRSYSYWL